MDQSQKPKKQINNTLIDYWLSQNKDDKALNQQKLTLIKNKITKAPELNLEVKDISQKLNRLERSFMLNRSNGKRSSQSQKNVNHDKEQLGYLEVKVRESLVSLNNIQNNKNDESKHRIVDLYNKCIGQFAKTNKLKQKYQQLNRRKIEIQQQRKEIQIKRIKKQSTHLQEQAICQFNKNIILNMKMI